LINTHAHESTGQKKDCSKRWNVYSSCFRWKISFWNIFGVFWCVVIFSLLNFYDVFRISYEIVLLRIILVYLKLKIRKKDNLFYSKIRNEPHIENENNKSNTFKISMRKCTILIDKLMYLPTAFPDP
jgi:hypothetical protein